MKRRMRAPSPALVISVAALFVALGGTAMAAKGYIAGTHIRPHSIPKNRLTGGAIKSLRGAKGAHGAQGAQGAEGATGSQGPIGPSNGYFASASNNTTVTLNLPAGAYLLAGISTFMNPNASGQDQAGCSLELMGQGTVTSTNGSATIPNSTGYGQITDQGVAHLTTAGEILNACYDTSSGTTANTSVTATKLDTASP
jgi:hypothetical protein